jgi:hypothetical protein
MDSAPVSCLRIHGLSEDPLKECPLFPQVDPAFNSIHLL